MAELIPESASVIFQRMATDIVTAVPALDPQLRNSIINAITVADSNAFFEAYKTLERALDMSFWDTATGIYLERWAAIFGITRNAATKAIGFVTFTGVDTTLIPLGTSFSSDSGALYATLAGGTITATDNSVTSMTLLVNTVTVITDTDHGLASNIDVTMSGAVETEYNGTFPIVVTGLDSFTYTIIGSPSSPATGVILASATYANVQSQSDEFGSAENLSSGTAISIAQSIAGVDNRGFVSFDELAGGTDEESDESLRDRFLFRVQNPVSIFNRAWIEIEAKKVSGVTRVFVQTVDDLQGQIDVLNLTQVGGFATVETISPHGLGDGQPIGISGPNEPGYNTEQKRSLFIDSTKVGYLVDGNPSSPATGTNIKMNYSLSALGQVRVLFVRDNDPSIIPTPSEVQAVKDQLLLTLPVVPGEEDLIVLAPIPVTVDFTFGSFSPDTQAMKDAVTASLNSFFSTNVGVADDVLEIDYVNVIRNTLDSGGNQMGIFTLVSPVGNIAIGASEIGILGVITFP